MSSPLLVSIELVRRTLAHLQSGGRRGEEVVLLWLGRRRAGSIHIEKLWIPDQRAGSDYFEIPEESMEALFQELRRHRLFVAAQVHTHPRQAFHSYADDVWAIVRHSGALSLVLPYFALETEVDTFVHDTVLFVLSPTNEWTEVPAADRPKHYRITQ